MLCQKCNTEIPEGYMYCPTCGEEIIIVSDFEIKLEDNIDVTSIAATTEIPDLTKELKKNKKNSTNKHIKIGTLIAIICSVIVLVAIGIFVGIKLSNYYSYDFQYEKGILEANSGDYDDAIKTVKHLIDIEDTKDGRMLLADIYMAKSNYDAAIAVLYGAFDTNPDDVDICDKIVKCYEAQGDNRGIHELIANQNDSTLALRYSDYVSLSPTFSLESGTYIEPDPIKISSVGDGTIYYTTDGSTPTDKSFEYIGPIPLDTGVTVISAIYINEKGIVSDVVSATYAVEVSVPDNPVLLVESGTIKVPELVGIEPYEGGKVYYSSTGYPDNTSKEYTKPMLMPLGKSRYMFIAYNENGVESDIVIGSYDLVMDAKIDTSVAEYAISYQLASMGEDVSTKTYQAQYGYSDENHVVYVIEEKEGDKATGRKFAVDVESGELFVFESSKDKYSISPL